MSLWLVHVCCVQIFKKILSNFIYRYEVCIRPELDSCCISYVPCADEASSWTLDKDGAASPSAVETGSDCTADYLGITGAQTECVRRPGASLTSRICGAYFLASTQGQAPYTSSTVYETTTTVLAVPAKGKHI